MMVVLRNSLWLTVFAVAVGVGASCRSNRGTTAEPLSMELAIVAGLESPGDDEVWLLIRNQTSLTRAVCLQFLDDGSTEEGSLYPIGGKEKCQSPSGFEPVLAHGVRVFRIPPPTKEFIRSDWRKRIRIYIRMRSWSVQDNRWVEAVERTLEWTGDSVTGRALGGRLIGR